MNYKKTIDIPGCFILERTVHSDERGTFGRLFCRSELGDAGLCVDIAQANLSTNLKAGTLRGLHFQTGAAAEDKLVTCVNGSVFDVCVDIRKDSPTYCRWIGVELSADNNKSLYVPKGCAHGYLTLSDNAAVMYLTTQFYTPGMESGYRYDDPAFGIEWPLPEPFIMSGKDKALGFIDL